MSMAQNTMTIAQILDLSDLEVVMMAEEHLEVESNNEVEEIISNMESNLDNEDKLVLAEFIVTCQNLMPY